MVDLGVDVPHRGFSAHAEQALLQAWSGSGEVVRFAGDTVCSDRQTLGNATNIQSITPLYAAFYHSVMADHTAGPPAERDADEMANADGTLLTTREVAVLFRVARSTVTSWAYRGLLPYTTTPTGHLRFYRASVERLLAERRGVQPTDWD